MKKYDGNKSEAQLVRDSMERGTDNKIAKVETYGVKTHISILKGAQTHAWKIITVLIIFVLGFSLGKILTNDNKDALSELKYNNSILQYRMNEVDGKVGALNYQLGIALTESRELKDNLTRALSVPQQTIVTQVTVNKAKVPIYPPVDLGGQCYQSKDCQAGTMDYATYCNTDDYKNGLADAGICRAMYNG